MRLAHVRVAALSVVGGGVLTLGVLSRHSAGKPAEACCGLAEPRDFHEPEPEPEPESEPERKREY